MCISANAVCLRLHGCVRCNDFVFTPENTALRVSNLTTRAVIKKDGKAQVDEASDLWVFPPIGAAVKIAPTLNVMVKRYDVSSCQVLLETKNAAAAETPQKKKMCLRAAPSILPSKLEIQFDIREHIAQKTMVQSPPLIVVGLEKAAKGKMLQTNRNFFDVQEKYRDEGLVRPDQGYPHSCLSSLVLYIAEISSVEAGHFYRGYDHNWKVKGVLWFGEPIMGVRGNDGKDCQSGTKPLIQFSNSFRFCKDCCSSACTR